MNFYKHYIGDYQRDTSHLSLNEHGAFRLTLDVYYATERPLPLDRNNLHRMLRAITPEEKAAVDSVLSQFWVETEDGFINPRGQKEISSASHQLETNRRIAKERSVKRKTGQPLDEQTTERGTKRGTNRKTERSTNLSPNQTPDSSIRKEGSVSESSLHSDSSTAAAPPDSELLSIPLSQVRPMNGDWKDALFKNGLDYLASTIGGKANGYRSLVGKWLKLAGDDAKAVFDVLVEAQRENIADPRSWVMAALSEPKTAYDDPEYKAVVARRLKEKHDEG